LKQVGVNEQVASELLGHASQSITYGMYGKESGVETLLNEIKKIKIETFGELFFKSNQDH